ncbi:MAG TPA: LytR family transcriptional regulator [Paenibacillus sp.]|uniref:LCP family protein n=1 Tax=Paenibacillus TaxID=44249 RepID=UPI000B9FBB0B|nr:MULTISPECIES: LCP family protein [Paenibacillus]OZQ68919.1 transcriptional regulator [Paenibacillus taichungensis]HBU83608.1 LytR family transcriptional regulator [Paenibacillus sp.]
MTSRTKDKKKKRRKGLYITLVSLVVLLIGGYLFRQQLAVAAFDLFLAGSVEDQLSRSYVPQEGNNTPDPTVYRKEPFSVLLLGSDKRAYEKTRGRSDTVIYAVVRPKESRVLLVSIPRDTYVQIVGRDANKDGEDDYDKLAHAYAFGGENMSINTVEKFLDADVGYYATINFDGIKKVVDALGGVKLPIDEDIVNKNPEHVQFTIEGGKPIYDGQEALYYVRYREDSDFNRTKRQQIFLNAMANEMLNLNAISKIPELIQIMGDSFQTDMQPSFIIDLAKQVLTQEKPQISSFTILGEGMRKDGIYYGQADEKDVQYAKELINNWMDESTPAGEVMIPDRQKIE